jgi:hypothetical protein
MCMFRYRYVILNTIPELANVVDPYPQGSQALRIQNCCSVSVLVSRSEISLKATKKVSRFKGELRINLKPENGTCSNNLLKFFHFKNQLLIGLDPE